MPNIERRLPFAFPVAMCCALACSRADPAVGPASTTSPATSSVAASTRTTTKVSVAVDAAAAPVAATTSSPPAGAPSAVPLGPFPPRAFGAGRGPDGMWTAAFALKRVTGDVNLTLLEAQALCRKDGGKSLCTESQWVRACAGDPTIGKLETWTITGINLDLFAVRGGEAGCLGMGSAAYEERKATRAAVCCDRAVAIHGDDTNPSFLGAASKWFLEHETAISRHDRAEVLKTYARGVDLFGWKLSERDIEKELDHDLARFPDLWLIHDKCEVRHAQHTGGDAGPVVRCRDTAYRDILHVRTTSYPPGGPNPKLVEE